MNDAIKAANAKAMWDRQCRYDLLHHQIRVRDLKAKGRLDWLERELLQKSIEIVSGAPYGTRSVDLSDSEYLAELDAFSAETK